jgi:hypothetical protein
MMVMDAIVPPTGIVFYVKILVIAAKIVEAADLCLVPPVCSPGLIKDSSNRL